MSLQKNTAPLDDTKPPVTLDWILLIFLACIWGCAFLFIKKALIVYPPIQMTFWRLFLAFLAYIPLTIIFWKKINWSKWKPMLGVALFGSALPSFAYAFAQSHISSSLAGVLNSLAPLFTFVLGVSVFGLAFNRGKLFGVMIGLVGAVLLVLKGAESSPDGSIVFALLAIVGTFCYAVNANIVRRYFQKEHPGGLAAGGFMILGVFFMLGLYFSGGIDTFLQSDTDFKALRYIAYLSVISTASASILYFYLLQRTGPVFGTSVTYLIPIIAVFLGIMDGEAFGLQEAIGMLIILSGLYILRKG